MESFESNIKEWVKLDNEIKNANNALKTLREKRETVGKTINTFVRENDLAESTIQISDGKLRFKQTRVESGISYKFIQTALSELYDDSQVEEIIAHLKKKREYKLVDEICRY